MADSLKDNFAVQRVSIASWSLALCAASSGTAGLAFAGNLGRSPVIGGFAGVAGFGTAALLAYQDRKEDAALLGAAASTVSALAYFPAWRTTRSPIILNAAAMSLVSLLFYGYKRQHPEEA